MANTQQEQAQKIYDEVTKFEVVLHHNDGDSYASRQAMAPLIQARNKLNDFIKHLGNVPFQPDR